MPDIRDVTLGDIWGKDAQTAIPAPPVSGIAYRNASAKDFAQGQKFDAVFDSARWNQLLYETTALVRLSEQYGGLPWSPLTLYPIGARAMGSNGEIYQAIKASTPASPQNPTSAATYWSIVKTDLSGVVPNTLTLSTTAPLQGGGALNANRVLSIAPASTTQAGSMSAADKAKLDGVAASATAPKINGTAAVGAEAAYSRGDHVHPTDSTRAPLVSPALTGTPTAPTAAAATNNTQLATTAYVTAAASFKAPLASPALTGTPTAPTAAAATNDTQVATTAYVTAAASSKAPLASPALTGTPTAPTAAATTNNTQVATTAHVKLYAAPLPKAAAGVGQWLLITKSGTPPSLPAGGTWAWFGLRSTGYTPPNMIAGTSDTGAGVAAGDTVVAMNNTLGQASQIYNYGILAWRIA